MRYTMKKNLLFLCCLLFSASMAFGQSADKIVGIWVPAKGTSQVRIFKATNGKYYGKVEWLKEDKDKLDVNNPDVKMRDKKIWGLMILKDFSYNTQKNRWEGGTVYDPDNGKTYHLKLTLSPDGRKLDVRGYIGTPLFGRSQTWMRSN